MGRPPHWVCVSDHKSLWICLIYSLYIPYISHMYFLAMFHIFSLVCFLIYGVKSKSGHDRRMSFGPILARFGSRNGILTKFINDSASFLQEKLKTKLFCQRTLIPDKKTRKYIKHPKNDSKILGNIAFNRCLDCET